MAYPPGKIVMLEVGPFNKLFQRVRDAYPFYNMDAIFDIAAGCISEGIIRWSYLSNREGAMDTVMTCVREHIEVLTINGGMDLSDALDDYGLWSEILSHVVRGIYLETSLPMLDEMEIILQDNYIHVAFWHTA